MTPDDPRHGTVAGHVAHRRAGVPYCQPCIHAKSSYDKRRVWDALNGRARIVPSLGARRRIQALQARGWSRQRIAAEAGWKTHDAFRYIDRSDTITRATFERIAAAYERLAMRTPPHAQSAARARNLAQRNGWPPPLAWDDIDDPDEIPDPGYMPPGPQRDPETRLFLPGNDPVDEVAVQRILDGDWRLSCTRAEKVAVVARWTGTLGELERLTDWKADRYVTREDPAA